MKSAKSVTEGYGGFPSGASLGGKVTQSRGKQTLYKQGDPAGSLYFIQSGGVRLTTQTKHQTSAVTTILGAGDLFGEVCLAGISLAHAHGRRTNS